MIVDGSCSFVIQRVADAFAWLVCGLGWGKCRFAAGDDWLSSVVNLPKKLVGARGAGVGGCHSA